MPRALVAVLLLSIAWLAVRDVRQQLYEPLPLDHVVRVEVPKGASLTRMLREWQASGHLRGARQRWYLTGHARLLRQDHSIKAGEYELAPGMRAVDLTALLVSGRVILHELRLVEGWRFEQTLEAVAGHAALARTLPDLSADSVMAALGHPELHPEGRFYPDTYRFPRGTSEVAFLKRAFAQMERILAEEWERRDPEVPYADAGEALIMASIVERETSIETERPEIAGVFVRRLRRGMRLQTDPSVIYGLGAAFDGNLRKRDLERDTPYNTYTRAGLPPSPICLPARASIHAALHPAPGDSLYFVSRGDGTHHFSASFAEHQAAVRKYQLGGRKK